MTYTCFKVIMYKKRTLAVLFLIIEASSFALDQYGGCHLGFLLTSVFVSLVSFLISIYNFSKRRSEVENERNVIELVFSILQLIVTSIDFISATLGVKLKLNASVFPLVLAITAVALVFKNNEQNFTDSSEIQREPISSNMSSVVVVITDSLVSRIQGAPTEEEIVDSSSLVLPVTSSNALVDSSNTSSTVVQNNDSLAPPIQGIPMVVDKEEMVDSSSPPIQGVPTVVDEEEMVDSSSPPIQGVPTVLFSKLIAKTDLEKELMVPSQAMKHFSIPEGKEFVDLVVKDLKGKIWNFRLTTHPRLALTDGWYEFVGAEELKPDDIVTFRKLKDEIFGEQYRVDVDRVRVI